MSLSAATEQAWDVVERDSVLCSTTVYFKHNSVWFEYANQYEISAMLDAYSSNKGSKLQVDAWCDSSGDEQKNAHISQLRANQVSRFFILNGVRSEDVSMAHGNGIDQLAASSALARRADVVLVVTCVDSIKRDHIEPQVELAPEPTLPLVAYSEVQNIDEKLADAEVELVADNLALDSVYISAALIGKRNSKKFDREVDHSIKYAYKGELMMGASVSYGELESDNAEIMLLLEGIDASGDFLSIKPYIGYFYKDNRCVGARFGYSSYGGELGDATLDLGDTNDLTIDIPYFKLRSESYSYGLFHRSYVGLDKASRIGLFAEVELIGAWSNGETAFEQSAGDVTTSISKTHSLELNFNPGAAVYVMPNVCATLSFGFGGVNFKSIKQYDENGDLTGKRTSSKMSFKFNVTAINFGINIHLWSTKGKF
ncbi:MAG: OmpA family protein [Rikenellaceae bacterium]